MRVLCMILVAALILSGCASAAPAAETVPAATLPTVPPETETQPTLPPDPVAELLKTMTAEEKVGQLFLVRCPSENALADIESYHLGGFVLFGQDIDGQTPETLIQTLTEYQSASSIPMFIAVDEEGGIVCRVSSNPAFRSSPFPSPRNSYDKAGMEMVLSMEIEKGYLLSSLGINVNLGPVCDVTTQRRAFMYSRSLGQDPVTTGEFAIGATELLRSFGVGSVLKHFPGYGDNADTHTGTAVDRRTLEELESRDLIPFSMAIISGCDAIMVSHTVVQALDPEHPATLSPAVNQYLRNVLGFDGVVVTDDLYMEAIRREYGIGEAAVLAFLAGNDLLCCTEYREQYPAVLEGVRSGRIPMEQLDASVERILRWKQAIGLIQ